MIDYFLNEYVILGCFCCICIIAFILISSHDMILMWFVFDLLDGSIEPKKFNKNLKPETWKPGDDGDDDNDYDN